nr:hypothetical protein SHINE37_43808 [Rhizobiaceae bacterium]
MIAPGLSTGHEKFRDCLKVPVDRRRKKSNDMTVDAAPAVGGTAGGIPLRMQCTRTDNAGVV